MTIENKYIPYAQRGFATVLIVLLVGLAVAASALGTAYYINTSQKSLVSSHALTNAQSGAWTGVEIFRKYLNNLDVAGIASLHDQNLTLKVQGGRELKVNNISSIETSNNPKEYRVTANIQNISEKSESSASIQVIYLITLSKSENSTNENTSVNAINIHGDLKVAGGIEIKGGKNAVVNVHGNFESTGNTFIGVNQLNVTGHVTLNGGGERIGTIVSNGDVYLGSGSEVDFVYAKGKITVHTGKQVGEMYADKDIIISNGSVKVANTLQNISLSSGGTGTILIAGGDINISNGSVGSADAQGKIDFSGSNANILTAGGTITISNGSVSTVKSRGEIKINGGNIGNALAKGNINVNSNSVTLSKSTTEKTFICNADWWNKIESITAQTIEYKKESCIKNATVTINISSIPVVNFSSNEPKTPSGSTKSVIVTEGVIVNVLDNLADANYIFYIDSNQRIKVKVQNIRDQSTNISYDGDYYLAKIKLGGNQYWSGNPYTGYLCKDIDPKDPEFCANTQITGELKSYIYQLKLFPNEPNTTNGQFVTYQSYDKTWVLVDNSYKGSPSSNAPNIPSLAPGIMFFYGNLNIGQGAYNNSMLATGNINASIPSIYSPNYAGANKVCNVSGYKMPSNLCKSSSEIINTDIGDIALMAGTCTNRSSLQNCRLTYSGGNINLTSNAYIYGKVIAGSRFNTSGASKIAGQITAANLGASENSSSSFNSKVEIDLTNVKNDSGHDSNNDNSTGSDEIFTKIKWARYL